jgi:tetratricopeptide (TPR) repeat protein
MARVESVSTVARALTETLDCAVLAMRYAVEDEFAIALSAALYDNLFRQRQSFPSAAQHALAKALGTNGPTAGALSVATPAIFGTKAAELELVPPRCPAGRFVVEQSGVACFPHEPEHFVGRVMAMARASAALAVRSDRSGVLFYGMAGAGKTSCAVELAYQHQAAARFQAFVWYRAPEPDKDISLALRDFALAMENQLPGFTMVHTVDQVETFRNWLPRLTEMLANKAVLVVLDNLESLLGVSGQWRDERWGLVVDALLKPGGLSRTVLTSRIPPAELPASTEVLVIHALPRDEALLLVRELPNLRQLLNNDVAGNRQLVHRALRLVQGHPKLIEFAEHLAAEPQLLLTQLERAEAKIGSEQLDTFFREGKTSFDAAAFTRSLHDWTTGITDTLAEPAQIFFRFLCCLEEEDRKNQILSAKWADLLKRLGRSETAPHLDELIARLVAAGLVEKKAISHEGEGFQLVVHPAVAEAGRAEAGPTFQAEVDIELAVAWRTWMRQALKHYGKTQEGWKLIVRAGLSAFPYLSRRQEWKTASWMLELVDNIDDAPATVAAVLPRLRSIAKATRGTERELIDRGLLARLLRKIGRIAEAEAEIYTILARALDRGDFGTAATAAGDLVNLLRDSGQLDRALRVIGEMEEYTRRAGHGDWAQLANEGQRLQILNLRGEPGEVLSRVIGLLERMRSLPELANRNSPIPSWQVREIITEAGAAAAAQLGQWQQALDLNEEVVRSTQRRGATSLGLAKVEFNNYFPLLHLKRYAEVHELLVRCRSVFERENSVVMIGMALSASAELEDQLGRPAEARRFVENALRYRYIVGNPDHIAADHYNLATYIMHSKGACCDVLANRLAGMLVRQMMRQRLDRPSLAVLEGELRQIGQKGCANFPKDFTALCTTVERLNGVQFRKLMERLTGGHIDGDSLLRQVLAAANDGYGHRRGPGPG